jgi:hypothetical protein
MRTRRRPPDPSVRRGAMRRWLLALSVTCLLVGGSILPAAAAPPERSDEPYSVVIPDEEHRLVVFWNIRRDDLCAWFADGFPGAPPVIEPVPVQFISVGQDALVASGHATRPLELWRMDDDATLEGPCEDTDDQAGPWAIGRGAWHGNDNDLTGAAPRGNAWGDRIRATVTDTEGMSWRYDVNLRWLATPGGEVREILWRTSLRAAA